jgi:hypothetical protein
MLWYWNMWNVGKEKRFVCCCQFLGWVEVFVYEKVFQNKLNAERCEIKVLYRVLSILLTIVQRYTHISGWITIVQKTLMWVYCKCVVWIDIVIYLWILPNMHSYSLHPFNWMQFINDRKMNSCMNRWMTSKWMNVVHPFLNYIRLYNTFVL